MMRKKFDVRKVLGKSQGTSHFLHAQTLKTDSLLLGEQTNYAGQQLREPSFAERKVDLRLEAELDGAS